MSKAIDCGNVWYEFDPHQLFPTKVGSGKKRKIYLGEDSDDDYNPGGDDEDDDGDGGREDSGEDDDCGKNVGDGEDD